MSIGSRTLTIAKEGYITYKILGIVISEDEVTLVDDGSPIVVRAVDDKFLFDSGIIYYDLGNYETAITTFQQLINDYPDSEYSDDAQYYIAWSYFCLTYYEQAIIEFEKVIKNDLHPTKEGLTMGEVLNEINKQSKGQAAIVSDVGQHQMIACRYAEFNVSKSNITSGGLGTMGFALPAAIGAKMAAPEREVVAIIGDGGYQMTIQELGTIFQTKVPVKIVVLNNDFLGMVRQWQQLFFDKRYASTEMTNPDFVAIAKGYYVDAKRVTKRDELASAIEEMMQSENAYFLEVCVEKEDNVFPMVPSGASVSDIRLE